MIDISFSFIELEYFLLILVRVTTFIFIAPFFGMNNTPRRVKVAMGIFISFLISSNVPHVEVVYSTLMGFAAVVLREALCGLLIGLGANMCLTIATFAGRIIDMEIGLMMASVMDPTTRENSSLTGLLYNQFIMLLLIITGMYHFLLGALIDTFTLIPINGAVFRLDSLLASLLMFLRDYIVIGFRIALPIFIVITLLNALLGILAKVAPQMNMFAVGMQMKILVGFAVLLLTVGMIPSAADFIFDEMRNIVTVMVRVMQP